GALGAFVIDTDKYGNRSYGPNTVGCAQIIDGDAGACGVAMANAEACINAACTHFQGTCFVCDTAAATGTCYKWQAAADNACTEDVYAPCLYNQPGPVTKPTYLLDPVAFGMFFCGNAN